MGASARLVLAANLNRLMAESANLKTIKQLHDASGVSTGTIDRIRRAQVSAGVDQLTALAKPFGLEPWQLLEAGVKAAKTEPLPPPVSDSALLVAMAYDKMRPAEKMRLDRLMAAAMDMPLPQENMPTYLGGVSGLGELDEPNIKKKGS